MDQLPIFFRGTRCLVDQSHHSRDGQRIKRDEAALHSHVDEEPEGLTEGPRNLNLLSRHLEKISQIIPQMMVYSGKWTIHLKQTQDFDPKKTGKQKLDGSWDFSLPYLWVPSTKGMTKGKYLESSWDLEQLCKWFLSVLGTHKSTRWCSRDPRNPPETCGGRQIQLIFDMSWPFFPTVAQNIPKPVLSPPCDLQDGFLAIKPGKRSGSNGFTGIHRIWPPKQG